jgi:inward rectifier potassium channel
LETPAEKKEELELGFGSKRYKQSVRFIRPDGSVNVHRSGLGRLSNIDAYHWLISVKGKTLGLVILAWYLLINFTFALIYFLIGPENFGGIDNSSALQQFISLFFFSAQTITTLGYGYIYPTGNAASTAAAVESLLGLLSFAIATGILFGRFSRPRAHILYSRNILIAPFHGGKALMFRVTNRKQYELIEAEASLTMAINNPETGKREFHNLVLEVARVNFLALSWTIVHPLDEHSPLRGLSRSDLVDRDAELLILIKAINDTFSQTVFSRYSYKAEDVTENAKFKPLKQEVRDDGKVRISVSDIHHFESVEN